MTHSEIIYRDCSAEDIAEITSLINNVGGDDRILEYQQFIVACNNKKIVGCVRTVQAEADCKELVSLVVLSKYRKRGIGTTLVNKILTKDTYRPLYLFCSPSKIKFYEKHNFFQVDIILLPKTLYRDFIDMTKEKKLNLVVMVLK